MIVCIYYLLFLHEHKTLRSVSYTRIRLFRRAEKINNPQRSDRSKLYNRPSPFVHKCSNRRDSKRSITRTTVSSSGRYLCIMSRRDIILLSWRARARTRCILMRQYTHAVLCGRCSIYRPT